MTIHARTTPARGRSERVVAGHQASPALDLVERAPADVAAATVGTEVVALAGEDQVVAATAGTVIAPTST